MIAMKYQYPLHTHQGAYISTVSRLFYVQHMFHKLCLLNIAFAHVHARHERITLRIRIKPHDMQPIFCDGR